MNRATNTINALALALSNYNAGEPEKRTAVTMAHNALRDIYGNRETANAVLWAVCETCHVTGRRIPPSVIDRIKDLTA